MFVWPEGTLTDTIYTDRNSVNFRNSDCVAVCVDTSRVSTVQCVANTLFLTLEQAFSRIKSLSVYRSTSMLIGKFWHEHFVSPQEVASLSQQGRIAAVQRTCVIFSIE